MAEPHKSFTEAGVAWVGHVSLLWWLAFDVIGGLSTTASWMYAHQFIAGSVTTLTIISIFLTFLAKAMRDAESPILTLQDALPDQPPTDDKRNRDIKKRGFLIARLNEFIKEARKIDESDPLYLAKFNFGVGGKIEAFLRLHLPERVAQFQQERVYALEEIIRDLLDDSLAINQLPSKQERSTRVVPGTSQQPSGGQPTEARLVSLRELEEEYEPLKKLEPHFVDIGNEYVSAYDDEKGVIVRGALPGKESFHVLARSFGNDHPRNKIKSLKKVSFRLNFICFDRATRHKYAGVNIHRGAWLTEAETEVEFPAHCPPRRAVIVTAEGAENSVYAVRRDSDSSYKGILPLREKLTGTIYTVFLTLLVESRNSKAFQYILEIIREPSFELFLNEAVWWKSTHLGKFVGEGFEFSRRLHEIWKDAHDQVPFPPVDTNRPIFYNYALSGSDQPEPFDYTAANARIRAIEQEQEEKLTAEIKDWETRAADWVDLFIGAEQRDKFIKSEPSIENGFNRSQKSAFFRLGPPLRKGSPPPPLKLPYWTLSDAVDARRDKLMEIIKGLR